MANQIAQHIAEAGTATMQTKAAYVASVTGLGVSVLTINEIVGVAVGLTSILVMTITAWSNHKKNKKQMALADLEIAHLRDRRTNDK